MYLSSVLLDNVRSISDTPSIHRTRGSPSDYDSCKGIAGGVRIKRTLPALVTMAKTREVACNWKNMADQLRVLKDGIEKLDKKIWRKRRDLGEKIEDYRKGA